jgi:hypothetical protein
MNCKVERCKRKVSSKGYCKMHYLRQWRTGETGEAELRKAPNGTYSRIIGGKKYWIKGKGPSGYYRDYRERRRKEDPGALKTVGFMHRLRFGGLRREVLERDAHTCQICGMTDKEHRERWDREITLDHIDGRGRYNDHPNHVKENLWVLCLSCHGRRDFYKWYLSQGKAVPIELIEALRLETEF